ncbi:MAG: right-handed parallel beta-helix repeat-containing protein, partial [Planctomycetota bacterium]
MSNSRSALAFVVLLASVCMAITTAQAQTTWYVDDDTCPAAGDGSKGAPFCDLQDALAIATSGDEIWVAEGTYTPTGPGGARDISFVLVDGVAHYGGFPSGFGGGKSGSRDPDVYVTALSGDLNGDDGPDFANNSENSNHVVTGRYVDAATVLDGFAITDGNANGDFSSPSAFGGGMLNDGGSPTVTNCMFSGNFAKVGGGASNVANSSPTVADCGFSGNSALAGAGMLNFDGSDPTVTNCMFSGNSASADGGEGGSGMFNFLSSPTVADCTFTGNSADLDGGGMTNAGSHPTVTNCTFNGNSADERGGGMFNRDGSDPTVTNCTFSGNAAHFGGGMYNVDSSPTVTNCTLSGNVSDVGGGMLNILNAHPTVTNCVLWGNGGGAFGGPDDAIVTFSDVEGGF